MGRGEREREEFESLEEILGEVERRTLDWRKKRKRRRRDIPLEDSTYCREREAKMIIWEEGDRRGASGYYFVVLGFPTIVEQWTMVDRLFAFPRNFLLK